jgi:hypothetical protein
MYWFDWDDVFWLLGLGSAIVILAAVYATLIIRTLVKLLLVERLMRQRLAAIERRPLLPIRAE